LAKKYRHIKSELQPIFDQPANGSKPGDPVPQCQPRFSVVASALKSYHPIYNADFLALLSKLGFVLQG
jgi:hypothetical protein